MFVAGTGRCIVVTFAAAGIVAIFVGGETGDRVSRIGWTGGLRFGGRGAGLLVAVRFRCVGAGAFAQALKQRGLAAQLRGRHVGCRLVMLRRRGDDACAMRGGGVHGAARSIT